MLALKKKGFTLIEIVIVLAIAALILVIVFLAVGGAQRSQRDNASQDAAGKVVAAFSNYLGDNNGVATIGTAIDTAAGAPPKYPSYLKDITSGTGVIPTLSSTAPTNTTTFVYSVGGSCSSTGVYTPGSGTGTSTKVAVAYWSETANKVVCRSN